MVDVKVTNTGIAPEAYFIDGRLDASAQYDLPSISSAQATVPLSVTGSIPFYLVPSETTELDGDGHDGRKRTDPVGYGCSHR